MAMFLLVATTHTVQTETISTSTGSWDGEYCLEQDHCMWLLIMMVTWDCRGIKWGLTLCNAHNSPFSEAHELWNAQL